MHCAHIRDEDHTRLVAAVSGLPVRDPQQQQRQDIGEPRQAADEGQVDVRPID